MVWRHYIPKGPVSASPAGLRPQELPQPGLSAAPGRPLEPWPCWWENGTTPPLCPTSGMSS